MCEIWRILGSNHPVCFVVVWKPSTSLKCSDVEALCPCPSVDIHVSQCCYDAHWYVCFGAVSLFSSIFRGRARDVLSCVCALADWCVFNMNINSHMSRITLIKLLLNKITSCCLLLILLLRTRCWNNVSPFEYFIRTFIALSLWIS